MKLMLEDQNITYNSFLNICKTSWKKFVKIVLWELQEILSYYSKSGNPFCDKNVLTFLEYFWLVRRLVHVTLIMLMISILPSFMFARSFGNMVNVARAKLSVNTVDLINFLDIFWKADRSLKQSQIFFFILIRSL